MRPTAARSNRSSVYHPRSSPIPSPSTTSVYHQPQQQILYAPISNPMVTLQPCGTVLHPSYVYPSVQSHIGSPNSAALHLQGKNNRWHSKNKPSRGQLYYQQQQPLSCNPKPVVLLDQPSSSIAPIPSSTTSYLVASSTFAHAEPLSSQHYNNSGVTHLLPQSFNFKPSNVQTFCLIQDRQNAQQQQQQHPMQASYYNISATNTCSLQTVNANSSFPLPSNINPYTNLATFNTNQFPMTVRSSPLFTNPPVGLILAPTRKDNKSLPVLDLSPVKHDANKTPSSVCESQVVPVTHSDNFNSWPPQIETSAKNSCDAHTASNNKSLESADRDSQKPISAKTDEEHYSDESSISFDFTIEAEKMVSALCNTTSSNDLNKEESKPDNKTDSAALFSGAGDNVSNRTNWFTDFCSEYENGTSIGVQTDAYPNTDRSQYPELIRKTAYWGCTEAEIVLGSNNSQTDDSKQTWLTCLSSATRTAITKSSICIPVFAGDRVLANDLINALLRISNGWLSLDNYLNKQHFPNLFDRLEPELIACFHTWEESTCQLLKQIVRTFQKFGENNEVTDEKYNTNCESSSFPGDVSLYMNYNLFAQPSSSSFTQQNTVRKASSREYLPSVTSTPLSTSSLHNFQYTSDQQEQQSAAQKESKLRSKWTITENLSSMINTTKSVPNVYHATDIGGLANTKLRTKNASTSRKIESSQKSLNAEFCQLRDKVMVSNVDAAKQDRRQARKLKFRSETKHSGSHNNTDQSTMNTPPLTYSGLYAQNSSSFTFPLSSHPSSSSYPGSNPGILTYSGHPSSSDYSYPITDINSKSSRNSEQNYGSKSANIHSAYVGRPQTDQTEFPTVPRNKMTLLSQIEPRTFDKESKEMAANLSAWFASMRNAQPPATTSTFEEFRMNENSESRLFAQQEMPKFSTQSKQPQIDANRQFQALQNLPNIQSTPWAAANFVNRHQTTQHAPEEYDSSEDVRVYMKPGSYNVPRKRHQRRSNRRQSDNSNATSRNASSHYNVGSKGKNISILASSTPLSHANAPTISNSTLIKTSFPPASQLPAPLFDLENSPRILKHAESLSQDAHQDITWKAACASAEILLEALNVKDSGNTCKKIDCNDNNEKDDKNKNNETSQQNDLKLLKHNSVDYASSYEASEDDSGSTCKLSPNTSVLSASQLCEEENAFGIKTNVKTDSWLIRTLNNASIVGKQKQQHKDDVDLRSLESSNSSEIADVKLDQVAASSIADADTKTPVTVVNREYPAISSREHISGSFSRNDETSTKESESYVGRATYSETVRRSMKPNNILDRKEPSKSSSSTATVIPIPGRKCQRKDPEQSYQLLHKSRRSADKKTGKSAGGNDFQLEEGSCAKVSGAKSNNVMSKFPIAVKTHGKKDLEHSSKDKCTIKSSDRGWSIWYSSRRKQSLSPLALSKLEMIHQTVWQMDEAKIFKYPLSCDNKDGQSLSAGIMEDYCKVVKSPMFLEIVEYKLKNRIYHKVEHAVKDFRRIIHNARLYHQHDDERTKKIEVLSKKLEDLLEEHFDNWDFENITGSPREDSSVQKTRLKTIGQKPNAGRCDSAKKGTSSLVNVENSSFH